MTEPRWLSEQEQEIWIAYLLATRLLWGQLERDMQRGTNMPLTYYEILSVLSDRPDRSARMSDIATMLQVSPSRLSHAVTRLESMGCVRREICPSDRRGWLAVLTEEGSRLVESAAPTHVESVRNRLFNQLTGIQREQLGEISKSLLAHLTRGNQPMHDALARMAEVRPTRDTGS
ncbi:MAG: MarR family transcriptional regulator [Chloroflexota bacterium]